MLSSSLARLEARADERSRRWPHRQRLPVLPPQLDRRRRLPGRSVHLELRPRLLVGRLDVVLHQHGDRHAQLRQRRPGLLDADGHGRRHVPRGLLPVDELRQGLQLPRRDVRRRAVLVRPEELRATGTRLPYGVRERPRERVRRRAVPGRDVRRGVPVGRRGGRVHEERARRRLVRPSPNLLLGLAGVLFSSRRIADAFPALYFRAAPVEQTRRASPASVSRCSRPGRRRPSQTRSTALHPSSRPLLSPTTFSRLQHTPRATLQPLQPRPRPPRLRLSRSRTRSSLLSSPTTSQPSALDSAAPSSNRPPRTISSAPSRSRPAPSPAARRSRPPQMHRAAATRAPSPSSCAPSPPRWPRREAGTSASTCVTRSTRAAAASRSARGGTARGTCRTRRALVARSARASSLRARGDGDRTRRRGSA